MSLAKIIASTKPFQALDASQLDRIARLAKVESYPDDTLLTEQGSKVTHLHLVQSGKVQLIMDRRLWPREITLRSIFTMLEAGDTFGWSALVEPHVATLSAQSVGKCSLISIDGQELQRLLDDDHSMGYRVMTALASLVAERLRTISLSLMSARVADVRGQPLPM